VRLDVAGNVDDIGNRLNKEKGVLQTCSKWILTVIRQEAALPINLWRVASCVVKIGINASDTTRFGDTSKSLSSAEKGEDQGDNCLQ
jgi:hypothetical protein